MKLFVAILIVGFACVLEAGKHDPLLEALLSATGEIDAIKDNAVEGRYTRGSCENKKWWCFFFWRCPGDSWYVNYCRKDYCSCKSCEKTATKIANDEDEDCHQRNEICESCDIYIDHNGHTIYPDN